MSRRLQVALQLIRSTYGPELRREIATRSPRALAEAIAPDLRQLVAPLDGRSVADMLRELAQLMEG